MSAPNAHRRPGANGTATVEQETGGQLFSVPMVTPSPVSDQSRAKTALETALVAVFWQGPDRSRRRTFFTLKSAERAVQRARARGDEAHLLVCELRPVREVDVREEDGR